MTKIITSLTLFAVVNLLIILNIGEDIAAYAQTYPCASPSPLPYPDSNTCLQAFFTVRPDCCDIDFDMSCYTDINNFPPGGFSEVCEDGSITTWENCYDHNLYDGINIAGTNTTCMLVQATLPPLFLFGGFECCDATNCVPCFTSCDPPPNDGVCPLAPVTPYDGCLVEVLLFDGLCGGFKQCLPPGDPNCVFDITGGWDMCCDMIYNDLSNGTPPSSFTLSPPDPYTNCGYGAAKPSGSARYPCDDLNPNTIDKCDPVIGCMNIPNFSNVTPAANIKLWLQGADLGGTSMATNPNISSGQPFNTAPWNYNGNEGAAIPSNVVDWVLVQALNTTTFAIEDQAAGFLLDDGTVQDIDGTTGQIKFLGGSLAVAGSYYIAVRTRGHLDVISATPVSVLGSVQYDFTSAASQALNTTNATDQEQMIEVNGKFALYSGDTNGNGIINFEDFNDYFLQIGSGYRTADFNHDGQVNGVDFDPHFSNNNGIIGTIELRY